MSGNVYAIDRRNHIHVFTNGVAPEPDGTLSIVESLREGLDYDQMWARYGNWNPRRTSTTA